MDNKPVVRVNAHLCPVCSTEMVHTPDVNIRIYSCFKCMSMYKQWSEERLMSNFFQVMKRNGPNDWLFGGNRQTTTNQIWAESLEKLYENWIAKQVVT